MKTILEDSATVSVRYIVNDVDTCVKFYTKVLGFEVEMHSPNGFAMLSKGNLHLLLNKPGAGGAGQSMPDGIAPSPGGGWGRFQLEVDDLESMVDHLKRKDVKFRNDIVSAPAGKQILLIDPAGNFIELFEPTKVK
ncbi:MAG TPA: VOC family protein [Cyclobacteriaceae bacterium]|nr:VOC family protein [Cyclobacteriaceae bacterium]